MAVWQLPNEHRLPSVDCIPTPLVVAWLTCMLPPSTMALPNHRFAHAALHMMTPRPNQKENILALSKACVDLHLQLRSPSTKCRGKQPVHIRRGSMVSRSTPLRTVVPLATTAPRPTTTIVPPQLNLINPTPPSPSTNMSATASSKRAPKAKRGSKRAPPRGFPKQGSDPSSSAAEPSNNTNKSSKTAKIKRRAPDLLYYLC